METSQIKNAKLLGGLGVIFLLLGVIPYIGLVLALAGLIMLIVANKTFSKILNKPNIYTNTVLGIIAEFIGGLTAFLLFMGSMIGLSSFSSEAQTVGSLTFFLGLIILYIFTVGGSYLVKKAFDEIAKAFNSDLLAWGAKLIFWGSIGIIIFGLGAIAEFVGWLLVAIAYFTLIPELKTNKM